MQNNLLKIKNLNKIYHSIDKELYALKDISFNVKENEFISIVGPSGCGKSTILSIISNMIPKTSGTIEFSIKNPRIGYMLQEDALFSWRTVLDNACLGLEIKKELNKKTKNKVIKLLKKYGLNDFIYSYPNSLSGGLKQRVALIRTLALNPDILLLDEPFSALDYQTRLALSDDLKNIITNEKKTTIMVTHDIAEAISMSDKVIILTKRPGTIKKVIEINLDKKGNPTENRKDKYFAKYYETIWKELDHHV
ncbi:MAG: ABC transporter ATP-binding protein [Bacilli bacterium]|nr:ABC transporter ATP-binding protein [Bacilli bacterium]